MTERRAARFGALTSLLGFSSCLPRPDAAFATRWMCVPKTCNFAYPTGIAVDSQDNVFVASYFKAGISRFDSSGRFLQKWGSKYTD